MHFENEHGEYIRYKDKPRFTGRGGARNIAENPMDVKIWARVLPEDKEKYFALGGSDWLRTAIREAYAAKARSPDGQ